MRDVAGSNEQSKTTQDGSEPLGSGVEPGGGEKSPPPPGEASRKKKVSGSGFEPARVWLRGFRVERATTRPRSELGFEGASLAKKVWRVGH